ncbi:MAG TPA: hypothetical protein VF530_18885 [Planctomycetota bacterium]
MRHPFSFRSALLAALGLSLPACTSDGGGGGDIGFQLVVISVEDNQVWKVNQEIVLTFTEPVDFSTVSLNTISIQTIDGMPATGSFFVPTTSPNQVVFQPTCPPGQGLEPGGETYKLRVLGLSSGAANTVRSVSGTALGITQERTFTTAQQDVQFLDTRPGPPAAVVRAQGSSDPNATHIEVGDAGQRVYFERDPMQNLVLSEPGFLAPLNLYSDPATKIAFVVEFDQPISPSSSNISPSRMRLEFQDGPDWFPLETSVVLDGNCTEAGASVRLTPIGPVPPATGLRAVLFSGIVDLVGEASSTTNDTFAFLDSRAIDYGSLTPADEQSDEVLEPFDFGAGSPLTRYDSQALIGVPSAQWGGGQLTAAFDFFEADECVGAPVNTFDWVASGQIVIDTDGSTIVSADGTMAQTIEGSGARAGVLDLRNMTINAGATVRVQGSNPLRINATGTVTINGVLNLSGFDARDVENVNTGNVLEEGARGGPGGGRGGRSNEVVTTSTPQGGFGQGPLTEINRGGEGGHTGFAPVEFGKEARRPGGGAGGRFATTGGENGFDGSDLALSAVDGLAPPLGGSIASGPFVDGIANNNFFGVRPVGSPGNVTSLIQGELASLWGGYGGGGGGNANPATVFPTPNWTPSSDEKGGAGGGGGGALHIRALGPIVFGPAGQIRANGGRGARGESVLQLDFIGGSGGSGSGGHVVLETAATITSPNVSAVGGTRVVGPSNTSAGGAGGPGVVQLHVPNPLGAPPTGVVSTPAANVLLPSYGGNSRARSQWITIGSADRREGGALALLRFVFAGTDPTLGPDEGKVLDVDMDGVVDELAPLVDEGLAGNGAIVSGLVLRLDGAPALFSGTTGGVSNDIYLRSPSLLAEFLLRLSVGAVAQDFRVASAAYDDGTGSLRLTIADEGTDLLDFTTANPGPVQVQLVPRFFRVQTCDELDALPVGSYVRILFQAAADDGTGQPDEDNPLIDWTGDISSFNGLSAGELQFFRFEVEFDLGAVSADTRPISLDFLRMPFLF